MAKLEKPVLTKITIGDWSKDGHEQYDEIFLQVNYPVSEIREAYKKSCKATGVQFNHNTDYAGRGRLYDNIWTNYEDNYITPKDAKVLKEHGILTETFILENGLRVDEKGYVDGFNPSVAASLIMRFIAYSMPKDFEHQTVPKPEVEPINGWWNDELDEAFGYGLYT